MRILVPCAGVSARFKDRGYHTIKPLLRVHDRTMAQFVSKNLPSEIPRVYAFTENHVEEAAKQIVGGSLVVARRAELGQAGTVADLLCACGDDEPVVVINCDSYHGPVAMRFVEYARLSGHEAAVCVFYSENPAYSYVEAPFFPLFERAVEKEVVSAYAMSGLYYFRRAAAARLAISKQIVNQRRHGSEYYLSGAFEFLEGAKSVFQIPESDVTDLGTPEGYEQYVRLTTRL